MAVNMDVEYPKLQRDNARLRLLLERAEEILKGIPEHTSLTHYANSWDGLVKKNTALLRDIEEEWTS